MPFFFSTKFFYLNTIGFINMILIGLTIAFLILILSSLFTSEISYPNKLSVYECGFDAFEDTRGIIDIQFYLIAILFMIFDLELLFLFPWAVCMNILTFFGLFTMAVFLFILTIGFIYEWKKGALDWKI